MPQNIAARVGFLLDPGNRVIISSSLRNNNQWQPMGSFLAFLRDQIRAIFSELVELLMGINWHIIPSFAKSRLINAIVMFSRGYREAAATQVSQLNLADFVRSDRPTNVFQYLFDIISCETFPGQVFNSLFIDDRKLEVSGDCL